MRPASVSLCIIWFIFVQSDHATCTGNATYCNTAPFAESVLMVQRAGREFQTSRSKVKNAKTALAFAGSAWRGIATDVGVLVGLSLVLVEKTPSSIAPTFENSGVLGRVSTLTTVSGSSTFVALLAYSDVFTSLLNEILSSPAQASLLYKAWYSSWMPESRFDAPYDGLADTFGVKSLTDALKYLQYGLKQGHSIREEVSKIMNASSLDPDNTYLGSHVGRWAKGKQWLVPHAILTPSNGKAATIWQDQHGMQSVKYIVSSSDIPLYTPAQFSVTLGAGVDHPAPVPYIMGSAALAGVALTYKAQDFSGVERFLATSEPLVDCSAVFEKNTAGLPLVDVLTAGMSMFGGGVLSDEWMLLVNQLHADPALWASSASDSAAYTFDVSPAKKVLEEHEGVLLDDGNRVVQSKLELGSDLVFSSNDVDKIAKANMRALVDGGYFDTTGVVAAVASGANEVTVIMDTASTEPWEDKGLHDLFDGGRGTGTYPGNLPRIYLQIFAEKASEVFARTEAFRNLSIPASNVLKDIMVGTLHVTTTGNEWVGLIAGRAVTLNIVAVFADCDSMMDTDKHVTLVQELIKAVVSQENAGIARRVLAWLELEM